MNETQITNLDEFNKYIKQTPAVLTYFSTKNCNVCKALKPKIIGMLEAKFPKMEFLYIDCDELPEISSQNTIFAIPSILVFFDGKETFKLSRHIGLTQLESGIERIYNLMFSD